MPNSPDSTGRYSHSGDELQAAYTDGCEDSYEIYQG